jgi:hypothetical protein
MVNPGGVITANGFKMFKPFKAFQPPSLSSPADTGEDEEGGLNEA